MARKPRLDFPGAFFHIIARGNQRTTRFRDDASDTASANLMIQAQTLITSRRLARYD